MSKSGQKQRKSNREAFSPFKLLDFMERGKRYSVAQLADRADLSRTETRQMLDVLANAGAIVPSSNSLNAVYVLASPAHASSTTSVATPPRRSMGGTLSGYDESLARHRNLSAWFRQTSRT